MFCVFSENKDKDTSAMNIINYIKSLFAAAPPAPPSTEFDRPWRHITWSEDRQNLLTTITNFQPQNPEVSTLRILVHGPVGSGKSSLVNSVNNVLKGRMTNRALANLGSDFAKTFTLECKTYKMKKGSSDTFFPFTFTDFAGMYDGASGIQTDDLTRLLKGHINDGYCFNPLRSITEEDPKFKRNPVLRDKIHCLVAVLPANTVTMLPDGILTQMKKVREAARDLGIPQVIIMTKVDEACPLVKENLEKIYTSKKIKNKMEACASSLGVPMNCIFPVKNYHEERTTDTTVDILILDALVNMINFANDYVEDQQA